MFVAVLVLATTVQAVRGIVLDNAVYHWTLDGTVADTGTGGDGTGQVPLTLEGDASFLLGTAGVLLPNGGTSKTSFIGIGNDGLPFAATDGVTFTAWVRFKSFQSDGKILCLLDDGWTNSIVLGTYGTTQRAVWEIRNGHGTLFLTPTYANDASMAFFPPVGQWAHIAAVATKTGTYTLYRDGTTHDGWTTSTNTVVPNPTVTHYTDASLGRSNRGAGSAYFDGLLRDVRLYGRALSGPDIAALAALEDPGLLPAHWWTMNEPEGSTIAGDAGGNADLTLEGGAAFHASHGWVELSNPHGYGSQFLDAGDDGLSFAATNGITFTAWVRFDSVQHTGRILDLWDSDSNWIVLVVANQRAEWSIMNGGTDKYLVTASPNSDASLAFFPPKGLWAHIAAVATTEGAYTLYRDGETRASTSCAESDSSAGCNKCTGWTCDAGVAPNPDAVAYTVSSLGQGAYHGDSFNGALRDVRLYARALDALEIAAVAAEWDPPPTHWWTMNEAEGSTTALDTGYAITVDLMLEGGAAFHASGEWVELSNPNEYVGHQFLDAGEFWFAATNGMTFTAWIRFDSFQKSGAIATFFADSENYIMLSTLGATRRARWSSAWNPQFDRKYETFFYTPAYANDASLAFFPPVGQWAHIAYVATGPAIPSTYTLYRDGETRVSTTCGDSGCGDCNGWTCDVGTPANPSSTHYQYAGLGGHGAVDFTVHHDGALRDVRLYERALDAFEIAAMAAEWDPPPPLTSHPTPTPTSHPTPTPTPLPTSLPTPHPTPRPTPTPTSTPTTSTPTAAPETCLADFIAYADRCSHYLGRIVNGMSRNADGTCAWTPV